MTINDTAHAEAVKLLKYTIARQTSSMLPLREELKDLKTKIDEISGLIKSTESVVQKLTDSLKTLESI